MDIHEMLKNNLDLDGDIDPKTGEYVNSKIVECPGHHMPNEIHHISHPITLVDDDRPAFGIRALNAINNILPASYPTGITPLDNRPAFATRELNGSRYIVPITLPTALDDIYSHIVSEKDECDTSDYNGDTLNIKDLLANIGESIVNMPQPRDQLFQSMKHYQYGLYSSSYRDKIIIPSEDLLNVIPKNVIDSGQNNTIEYIINNSCIKEVAKKIPETVWVDMYDQLTLVNRDKLFTFLGWSSITLGHDTYFYKNNVFTNKDNYLMGCQWRQITKKEKVLIDCLYNVYSYKDTCRLYSAICNNRLDIFKSIIVRNKGKKPVNSKFISSAINRQRKHKFNAVMEEFNLEVSYLKHFIKTPIINNTLDPHTSTGLYNMFNLIKTRKEYGYLIESFNKHVDSYAIERILSSSVLHKNTINIEKLKFKETIYAEYLYDNRYDYIEKNIDIDTQHLLNHYAQYDRKYVGAQCHKFNILDKVILSNDIGSRDCCTIYIKEFDTIICGCFSGTFVEFTEKVENEYGSRVGNRNRYYDEYMEFINIINLWKVSNNIG
jgi:hypothetical protein